MHHHQIEDPPESEPELLENPERFDLQRIFDSARKRICKWVRQSGTLNHLKEHQDYSVKVKLDASNKPTVSVLCTFCSKEYKLHSKDSTTDIDNEESKLNFMISNWTGHVKKCFNARSCKRAKQQTISKFLPSSDDKPTHMNKESIQTPAHQCLPNKTMSDNLSTPHKHATVGQLASKDVKLHKSPCGHVTHVNTPSSSSVNSNPPNDDKNKSPCGCVTRVNTPSLSSVNSNPPNDDKNKSPCGHVTHVNTPSSSSVNSNPPNDDKNKSPCGHVTHLDIPSPSSVNSNPPNDDKNKSPCGHVTHVDTPSPSSVNSNPPNDDKNKLPHGHVTHVDIPSPSSVNRNLPNDDKNTATDLTSIDETDQCFQQTSPVRVIQERL